ncbi:MAG TPA: F0F1 ATP synthase subunit C [Candidatus Ozemobacteraceae bacterium]|nr:F0F1 ATP synthase subunit C [Candidatus Ozemobacteraceae bacterium]
MEPLTLIAITSMIAAGALMFLGTVAPAFCEMKAILAALEALTKQPDEAGPITRTLFVGLAMIESMAIYCFVIAMILLLANPFWNFFIAKAAH